MTSPDLVVSGLHLVVSGLLEAQKTLAPDERWNLRPATIIDAGSTVINGTFDGEGVGGTATTHVQMISLIGFMAQGARVMTVTIPPAGVYVIADLTAAQSEYNISNTLDTTTSAVYTTAGAAVVGTSFIAPASGKVSIYWSGEIRNSLSAATLVSPQVAEGATLASGAVIVPVSDVYTLRSDTVGSVRSSNQRLLTISDGLIPRTEYNVTLYHRVTSGTGGIDRRSVLVTPVR